MSMLSPSPWVLEFEPEADDKWSIKSSDGWYIAVLLGSAGTGNSIAADAKLMCSAPKLLAALKTLEREANSSLDYRPEFRKAIADAHIAIAESLDVPY